MNERAIAVPGSGVVVGPDTNVLVEVVRPEDRRVACQVVEVVHDDSDEQIQHLTDEHVAMATPVSRNVVWGSLSAEWRRRMRRQGLGLGRGPCPLRRNIFVFSPSKCCILMHSGAHFRTINCNFHYDISRGITKINIKNSTFQQKSRPINFCADFSGGFNPRNPPPSEYGPDTSNRLIGLYRLQPVCVLQACMRQRQNHAVCIEVWDADRAISVVTQCLFGCSLPQAPSQLSAFGLIFFVR